MDHRGGTAWGALRFGTVRRRRRCPWYTGGLSILRASSVEEARRILAGDPFIRDGVFTVDVKKWMLMEGGLTLTVRFSDRSSRLL
ncbi:YciI family protein [Polaromonas sp. P1(28)-8]|nr:YciI family protein [Polaromonas sp. P1(28)-8]